MDARAGRRRARRRSGGAARVEAQVLGEPVAGRAPAWARAVGVARATRSRPTSRRRVVDAAAIVPVGGRSAEPVGARGALRGCLDGAWEATRAVANAAFIRQRAAGAIVYLAPAPARRRDARRCGARGPGEPRANAVDRVGALRDHDGDDRSRGRDCRRARLAALIAYLASPAGAYFSGCLLDLRRSRSARELSPRAQLYAYPARSCSRSQRPSSGSPSPRSVNAGWSGARRPARRRGIAIGVGFAASQRLARRSERDPDWLTGAPGARAAA